MRGRILTLSKNFNIYVVSYDVSQIEKVYLFVSGIRFDQDQ